MMKAKTEAENLESLKEKIEELQQLNQQLNQRLLVMTDLKNLEDQSYYRQQNLLLMERIAQAVEKNTAVLETSLSEEEETEEEPVEEETKEELKETTK